MTDYDYPNVSLVRRDARRAWEKAVRGRITPQERITQMIPWWLVIIALVFYALSSQHTATVFEKIVPHFGFLAPIGFEFTLIYASFARKQAQLHNEKPLRATLVLEVMVFILAIPVNFAGALEAVTASIGIESLTLSTLFGQLGDFPATTTVAILLIPLAAVCIPTGASVAGSGWAALVFNRKRTGSIMEERWKEEGTDVEFAALRDAAINNGVPVKDAIRWASRISGTSNAALVRLAALSDFQSSGQRNGAEPSGELPAGSALVPVQQERNVQRTQRMAPPETDRKYSKNMNARSQVEDYLRENPELASMSIYDLQAHLSEQGIDAGKSTVADVRKNFSSNGHGSSN